MANGAVKRLKYFKYQFLNAEDFLAEQKYHRDMRHRHNRVLHSAGVADGLGVRQSDVDETAIVVSPGTAIDAEGKEIVLLNEFRLSLAQHKGGDDVYVTIQYDEDESDEVKVPGVTDYTRVNETPDQDERVRSATSMPSGGLQILLAKVTRIGTRVDKVDTSVRPVAGAVSRADQIFSRQIKEADGDSGQNTEEGSGIKTAHIQDGAVVAAKLAANAVTSAKLAEADGTSEQETNAGAGIKTAHIQDGAVTLEKLALAARGKEFAAYCLYDGHGIGTLLDHDYIAGVTKASQRPGLYTFAWESPLPTSAPLVFSAHGRFWPGVNYAQERSVRVLHRTQTAVTIQVAGGGYVADGFVSLAVLGERPAELPPEPPPPPLSFAVPATYTVGPPTPAYNMPAAMVAADFNGNNRLDLAVPLSTGEVSILLAQPGGTFAAAVLYPTGFYNPMAIAARDLTGDGRIDLVVVGGGGMSVLRGNGDGTFFTVPTTSVYNMLDVALADLTGDGVVDAVVVAMYGSGLWIYKGDGTGGFTPGMYLPSTIGGGAYGNPGGGQIVVADLYGNGVNDIAGVTATGLEVIPGNGDGTFGPATSYTAPVPTLYGGGFRSIVAGDLTGDGALDIVAVSPWDNQIYVWLGNGAGKFTFSHSTFAGYAPAFAAIRDMTGDGRNDIVVANSPDSVGVLLGNGDGTFQPALPVAVLPWPYAYGYVGSGAQALAVGDFSGDGRPDVAVAKRQTNTVDVILQST